MTPRQKRIVAILAMANILVILALIGLVTHPSGTGPSPHPSYQTLTPLQQICQQRATQLLARAGLGGTVTLTFEGAASLPSTPEGAASLPSTPRGSLHFQITYPLASGQAVDADIDRASADIDRASEAAQSVWTAFDVALALQEQEAQCAIFTQVEVTVLIQNGQTDARISASARTADLAAFHAGELSEDDFIDRVTYATSAAGGE